MIPLPVHIFTDGGSRGNPGPGAWAFVAVETKPGERGRIIMKASRHMGICTNNEAEYQAVIHALEWARSAGVMRVHLHSDSELLVNQLLGAYKVRSKRLSGPHHRVRELLKGMEYTVEHHPREHRFISICDAMVNRTLDQEE